MHHLLLVALPAGFLCCTAVSFAQQTIEIPKMDGYVSRLDSAQMFEVDGRTVLVGEKTQSGCMSESGYLVGNPFMAPTLGDHVEVYGKLDGKMKAVRASFVCQPRHGVEKIAGLAVLEETKGAALVVDGRLLSITPKTVVHAVPPRSGIGDAKPGDWVHYGATIEPTGEVVAHEVTVSANTVSEREQKLRKHEFLRFTPPDPGTGKAGMVTFGHLSQSYKLPADQTLARVSQIGARLATVAQQRLKAGDPARVEMRFYAIAKYRLNDCFVSGNGSVFVPVEVVARLREDDQLAAV